MRRGELRDQHVLLDLFVPRPPLNWQQRLRCSGSRGADLTRRALVVAAIGWGVPFVFLAVRAGLVDGDALRSFASDFAVHARSLFAAPLLIVANAWAAPRLGAAAVHFVDAGLVPASERPDFDAIVASTIRLRETRLADAVVTVLSYAIVLGLVFLSLSHPLPVWQRPGHQGALELSLAGWWHTLVSIPLLLMLVLAWLWRLGLWTRFLWLVAGLELRLIPAHPDLAGGLRFLGYSLRAFSAVGMAFGAIVAGRLANQVAETGATPSMFLHTALILAVFVIVLFAAPLFVFLPDLLYVWRRGLLQYGGLASRVGREFENKWLGEEEQGPVLQVQDFSATTDLYSFVANVYQMRLVPVDYGSLAALVVSTLLPIVPVLFLVFPIEVIEEFVKLLF